MPSYLNRYFDMTPGVGRGHRRRLCAGEQDRDDPTVVLLRAKGKRDEDH